METKTTETTEPTENTEPTEPTEPAGKAEEVAAGPDSEGTGRAAADDGADLLDELDEDGHDGDDEVADGGQPDATGSGVGAAAAAVVSAALSVVALTGTWTGKVVAERETLVGQIKTSGTGTPAQQISEIYGDAWHSTALVNGVFALLAVIVAVLVLTLPRHPVWVRAIAVAGAVLGGLGLLLSVGTYFDLFLSLPTAGS